MISAPPLPQPFNYAQAQIEAGRRQAQAQSVAQPLTQSPATCACGKVFNLSVERGADLSSQITLTITDKTTGVKSPVDLTGATFQFTAKPHQTDGSQLPDSDPSVIKIDWPETATPTQGITWLKVPAATTVDMLSSPYDQQVRMVSASGVVTPLFTGSLVVTEPVSARF
jgi:hypothetical protein